MYHKAPISFLEQYSPEFHDQTSNHKNFFQENLQWSTVGVGSAHMQPQNFLKQKLTFE